MESLHYKERTVEWLTIVLIVTMVYSSPAPSLAQKYSLGIKAGPNISLARFRDEDLRNEFGSKPKPGFQVGGLIMFPMKEKYTFVAEAGYAQRGRRLTFNSDEWENSNTYQFIDLSMALRKSFRINFKENVIANWYFNVGPNVQHLLTGTGKIKTGGDPFKYKIRINQQPDADFNFNYYNDINRWMFGIDFGIGADAVIQRNQVIYAELRFTMGQTHLGKHTSESFMNILGFEDDLRSNIKTLSLTAAYIFDFDKKQNRMGKSTKDKKKRRRR
ncbi:MAG: porin family protein [Cyclobacteriaceae bacterium]